MQSLVSQKPPALDKPARSWYFYSDRRGPPSKIPIERGGNFAMDAHKKELIRAYKQRPLSGGVTIIRNTANGRYLLEAQTNVEGSRSRFAFMQATDSPPSMRMQKDWKSYGPSAFTFQVLEELIQKEGQTAEEFRADLAVLGELWAEKFDPALSY